MSRAHSRVIWISATRAHQKFFHDPGQTPPVKNQPPKSPKFILKPDRAPSSDLNVEADEFKPQIEETLSELSYEALEKSLELLKAQFNRERKK